MILKISNHILLFFTFIHLIKNKFLSFHMNYIVKWNKKSYKFPFWLFSVPILNTKYIHDLLNSNSFLFLYFRQISLCLLSFFFIIKMSFVHSLLAMSIWISLQIIHLIEIVNLQELLVQTAEYQFAILWHKYKKSSI